MKLLLGVTGSIAAYKSYDLCRELTKEGHEVKVILTNGALKFLNKDTFYYLGASDVYSPDDDFNTSKYKNFTVLHIELTKWADKLIVSPASANIISEFSHGYAKDLLTTLFLAFDKKVLIFPAMNTKMLNNEIIQENIQRLNKFERIYIHGTQSGELACGDNGEGKLEKIEIIKDLSLYFPEDLVNKSVLITTGSTVAPIDPVRYITNPSSGLTGYEIAKAYFSKGFKVTLIVGFAYDQRIDELNSYPNIKVLKSKTTQDMFQLVKDNIEKSDTYISCAAISDLEFESSPSKIKKDQFDTLPIAKRAPDILKYVLENRKNQKVIGFSAETESLEEKVLQKINSKPVDFMIGNIVSNGLNQEMKGFKNESNDYLIFKGKEPVISKKFTKKELAKEIFNLVENENI